MMAISYTYSTKAVITYDGIFNTTIRGSLDEIVAEAIKRINMYDFDTAIVTDANTGEVLVIIEDQGE